MNEIDLDFDHHNIWHPYTSLEHALPVYPVQKAKGVYLYLEDGKKLIDGMSSWWCVIHGYNHPRLNQAILSQVEKMSHVMFGGLTHEPGILLAKKILQIVPAGLEKIFFADSGSVAIEVAMKMALQFWFSRNNESKKKFLTLKNGYHGDTFHAMSVCDPISGMHQIYSGILPRYFFADSPTCAFNQPCSQADILSFEQLIRQNHAQLAAVILEPIVQGAGGMRIYSADYLFQVSQLCKQYDVLLILDEIATGFARTGKLFAAEHAAISPDILCLGKALTGGYMSLAAVVCTAEVASQISRGKPGLFMHGPTFMANPLACQVALASIELLLESDWQNKIKQIEKQLAGQLEKCRSLPVVADVRVLGAIGVVELARSVQMARIQKILVDRGIWLRPFGKLLYTMPPYIIDPAQLTCITDSIYQILDFYGETILAD